MASPEENSDEIIELTDIIKKGSLADQGGDSDEDVDLSFEQELEGLFSEDSGDSGGQSPERQSAADDSSFEDDLDALLSDGESGGDESEPAPSGPQAPKAQEPTDDSSFEDELDALLAGDDEQEQQPAAQAPEPPAKPAPRAMAEEPEDLDAELAEELDLAMSTASDKDIEDAAGPAEEAGDDFEAELDALLGDDEPKEDKPAPAEDDDLDLSELDSLAEELGEDRPAAKTQEDDDLDLTALDGVAEELDQKEPEAKSDGPADAPDKDDVDLSGLDDILNELGADDAEETKAEKPEPAAEDLLDEILDPVKGLEPEEDVDEALEEFEAAEEDAFEAALAAAETSEEPEAEEPAAEEEPAEAPAAEEDAFEAAMAAAEVAESPAAEEPETAEEIQEPGEEDAFDAAMAEMEGLKDLEDVAEEDGEEPAEDLEDALEAAMEEEDGEESLEAEEPEAVDEIQEPGAEDAFEAAMDEALEPVTDEAEEVAETEEEPVSAEEAANGILAQAETAASEIEDFEEEDQPSLAEVIQAADLEMPDEPELDHVDAHHGAGEFDLEVPPDLPPDTDLGLNAAPATPAAPAQPGTEMGAVMQRLEAMERRFHKELSRVQYRLDKAGAPELGEDDLQDLEGLPDLEERLATLEGKVLAREDLEALRATIDYEIMHRVEKVVPAAAAKVIREELAALIKDISS